MIRDNYFEIKEFFGCIGCVFYIYGEMFVCVEDFDIWCV